MCSANYTMQCAYKQVVIGIYSLFLVCVYLLYSCYSVAVEDNNYYVVFIRTFMDIYGAVSLLWL